MNRPLKPVRILNWILLFCCLTSSVGLEAQITHDKYFEFEASDEKAYIALDLDGHGVLIMESFVDTVNKKTTVHYKLLDNELKPQFETNVSYRAAVTYHSINVDTTIATIFYTNKMGYNVFQRIDLVNGTTSQININLNKNGRIEFMDFSKELPYFIRFQQNSEYSITTFDFETGDYLNEIIELKELTRPSNSTLEILDGTIDSTGENVTIAILVEYRASQYSRISAVEDGFIHLVKKNLVTGIEERSKIKYKKEERFTNLLGCGFDQDELVILSIARPERLAYEKSEILYKRYSDTTLLIEQQYAIAKCTNYNSLISSIIPKQDIKRYNNLDSDTPFPERGKLTIRSNGNCFYTGGLFFSPFFYRMPPNEARGLFYLMLISFDTNGKLLWEQEIKIETPADTKNFYDNSLSLLYSNNELDDFTGVSSHQNGKLTFHEINSTGTVFVRWNEKQILQQYPEDKIKFSTSKIIYMYGRTFLHYGIQRVKNKARNISPYKYLFFAGTIKI